jgi:hypothetical protein
MNLFSIYDFIFFPLAVLTLYLFSRIIEKKERKLFLSAYWIHVVVVVIHALILQFYWGSGDTTRYYMCINDVHNAVDDGVTTLWDVVSASKLESDSVLNYYFEMDAWGDNNWYMFNPGNYAVVRLGAPISFVFYKSYLAISLFFSYYALLGSWVFFKKLMVLYPTIKRELALALLFIPTVVFWSSTVLKDPITFGSLGFILYGVYNLFSRRKIFLSLLCIAIPAYITYVLKIYIILSFAPALVLLLLLTKSKDIRNIYLRNIFYIIMVGVSAGLGYLLYANLTSTEAANKYKAEVIFEQIDQQRGQFGLTEQIKGGSYYGGGSTTGAMAFPAGIVATFYRPYLWEIKNPVMGLSAIESFLFAVLTISSLFYIGVRKFFHTIFTDPLILFCFVFSMLFGGAIGASTANFGALVRYKIPGMPFYFLMILLIYYHTKTSYPKWFNKLISKINV